MKNFNLILFFLIIVLTIVNAQFPTWDDASQGSYTGDDTGTELNNGGSRNTEVTIGNETDSSNNSIGNTDTGNGTYYTAPKCGPELPVNWKDCSAASTETNSCCFYSIAGNTGCVYHGSQILGLNGKYGLSLTCNAAYINIGVMWIILFINLLL
jgi:hypothetical protein